MTIKIPRIKIVRPQHAQVAAEKILVAYITLSVPVSLFGWVKIYELIKPYLELIR